MKVIANIRAKTPGANIVPMQYYNGDDLAEAIVAAGQAAVLRDAVYFDTVSVVIELTE